MIKIQPTPGHGNSSPTKIPPGLIFPTKYQQDVNERRDFRHRMKAELKDLAKESFLEELERLRQQQSYLPQRTGGNNHSISNSDVERQLYLESEIQRLQSVVEDIRRQQPSTQPSAGGAAGGVVSGSYFPPMNVEWSNSIVRDQMTSPNFPPILSGGGFTAPHSTHHTAAAEHRPRAFSETTGDPVYDPSPFQVPKNQHFVLSSAPIQGFDELIKQETSLFRDTMNFTKSIPTTAHSTHQPHPPGTLTAGGTGGNSISIVEQANRFAEMQSLFQLPTNIPSFVSELNSFVDPEYQAMHEYANSPEGRYYERQRKLEEQTQHKQKLEKSISTHRERLDKGRNPTRRFPLSVPSTRQESRPGVSGQSPRVKIHQQRSLSAPTEGSQKILNTENTASDANNGNTSHNNQMEFLENSSNLSISTSPTRPAKTAPPSIVSMTSPTPMLTSRATSPQNDLRSPNDSAENNHPNASNEAKPAAEIVMTKEEFQLKTDKMQEELKKLVQEAVHKELMTEGKALRYTKRFQNHYITTQQPPLVHRIEKTVEEKIKALQSELTTLRTTRLNKTPIHRNLAELGGGAVTDDEHGWFGRSDLGGDPEIDMRSLTAEINRSVQGIIRRHLGGGGGGGGGISSADPNSSVVHGHIGSDSSFVDDKDIGFENLNEPVGRLGVPDTNKSPVSAANAAAAAAAKKNALVDDLPAKPKSKADRLLGISTDPKSGLPFNDPTSASHKPGLFGSIGSLFSTKPNDSSGAAVSSLMSTRFGTSNRNSSHSSVRGSTHSAAPLNAPALTAAAAAGSNPNSTSAIKGLEKVDEGAEDSVNSNKDHSDRKGRKTTTSRKGSTVSVGEAGASSAVSVTSDDNNTTAATGLDASAAAEIAVEEANYRTLMSNLLAAADLKMDVKKELKDWEKSFESKNGREPTNDDKMVMSERYIAYKMVCNQLQEAKDLVKASEDRLKELKDKAGVK